MSSGPPQHVGVELGYSTIGKFHREVVMLRVVGHRNNAGIFMQELD